MIITAPTGLYEPILPQRLGDAGNFTFTISDQPPPRSSGTFVQLPLPEVVRRQPDRVYTKLEKRAFAGDLVFNITVPGPATTGSGTPNFEIGQVLEFTEEELDSSDPYRLVSEELRQDLKVVDFESAGLTQEEYDILKVASEEKINDITSEIASVGSELNSNADSIQANQAKINNSESILENIILVLGSDSEQAAKVSNNISDLKSKKKDLLDTRSELQARLGVLRSELQKVREVVR